MDILQEIAAHKRKEIAALKSELSLAEIEKSLSDDGRIDFKAALSRTDRISVIAELKKASPSKGVIKENFDVTELAAKYKDGGAAALSVLTDKKYFQGSPEFILAAKSISNLPVLCKEFIIDPYQIYFAKLKKADAILLIVALLNAEKLTAMLQTADSLGLEVLVEVHDPAETKIAIDSGANIIGVNNRNLRDFSVSLETSEELSSIIPDSIIKVAESGIFEPKDVSRLNQFGYNCFLIGEALMKAADPIKLLKSLQAI